MEIYKLINSPIDSSGYFLVQGHHCIIIDPGSKNAEQYSEFLINESLILDYIILTHEHFDHIWSVNHLKKKFGGKIVCTDICANKISIPQNYFNLLYYNDDSCFCVMDVDILNAGELDIQWQDMMIHLFSTPGHSIGSMCIQIGNNLFTGDTILNKVRPLTKKLDGGSKIQLKKSIENIFDKCALDMIVYPGHGESFKLYEVVEFYKQYFQL